MPLGTLWRRALRRVDRRSAAYRALRPLADSGPAHCPDCARAWLLLAEAVRLANSLYPDTPRNR